MKSTSKPFNEAYGVHPVEMEEGDYVYTFFERTLPISAMLLLGRHRVGRITPCQVVLVEGHHCELCPIDPDTWSIGFPVTRAFNMLEWFPWMFEYRKRYLRREDLESNGRVYHSTSKALHFTEAAARDEFTKRLERQMNRRRASR